MAETPRKPFWKRKRWIAVAVLWLVVMYPLSVGPACYSRNRGWLGPEFWNVYLPVMIAIESIPGLGPSYDAYIHWWSGMGTDHASRWEPTGQ
jgi:hypothetical protein